MHKWFNLFIYDLIISNAHKRGATVIQDIDSYIQQATRQLEHTNFYKKKITINPTLEYKIEINTALFNFKRENLITEKTAKSLKLENPKIPKFYTSSKIYKQGNPGITVVNSISSHTSNYL